MSKVDMTCPGWGCRPGTRRSTREGKCNVTAALMPRDTRFCCQALVSGQRSRAQREHMRPPPPAALHPSSPQSSALKHLSQQRLGRPDKSGLLCCYSSFFVASGKWCVRQRSPHHTLSASFWVQAELGDLALARHASQRC